MSERYDRKVEQQIKRMRPEDLSDLMAGDEDVARDRPRARAGPYATGGCALAAATTRVAKHFKCVRSTIEVS